MTNLKKWAALNSKPLLSKISYQWLGCSLYILTGFLTLFSFSFFSFGAHVKYLLHFLSLSILNFVISISLEKKYYFIDIFLLSFFYIGISLIFLSLYMNGEIFYVKYMEIVHSSMFIIGLSLFITVTFVRAILTCVCLSDLSGFNLGIKILALNFQIAFLALVLSLYKIQILLEEYPIDLFHYYEMTFFSYSVILEFLYCSLLVVFSNILYSKYSVPYSKILSVIVIVMSLIVSFIILILCFYNPIDSYYLQSYLSSAVIINYLTISIYLSYQFYLFFISLKFFTLNWKSTLAFQFLVL